jgi:hypothetical protein
MTQCGATTGPAHRPQTQSPTHQARAPEKTPPLPASPQSRVPDRGPPKGGGQGPRHPDAAWTAPPGGTHDMIGAACDTLQRQLLAERARCATLDLQVRALCAELVRVADVTGVGPARERVWRVAQRWHGVCLSPHLALMISLVACSELPSGVSGWRCFGTLKACCKVGR